MRDLIDTNILVDYMIGRKSYFSYANQVVECCADGKLEGFMAAHSIPNIFYILRKDLSEDERREVLLGLCQILKVEGLDHLKILSALYKRDFSDFEDCLQAECAAAV